MHNDIFLDEYDPFSILDEPDSWDSSCNGTIGADDFSTHPTDDRAATLRAAAHQYDSAGLTVANARPAGGIPAKFPSRKKWNSDPAGIDDIVADIVGHVNGVPENLDILCGKHSCGLIIVDIDSPEAAVVWPQVQAAFGLPSTLQAGRPSAASCGHWYFRVDGDTASDRFAHPGKSDYNKKSTHIDLLGDDHCAMAPPSIHPDTGEQVEWRGGFVEPARVDGEQLRRAVRLTAVSAALARDWGNFHGKRNEIILSLAGTLAHAGYTVNQATAAVSALCEAAKDEESDQRVNTVNRTFQRHSQGESIVGIGGLKEALPGDLFKSVAKWLNLPKRIDSIADAPQNATGVQEWAPMSLAECIDIEPEPMKWIFEELIPEGIVAGISAADGTGKSYLTLQLAISAATGKVMLPTFVPVEPVAVMFFPGEDPVEVTRRRIWNTLQKYPLSEEERGLLEKNLYIYPHRSELLVQVKNDVLRTTERYAWMRTQILAIQPKLVILDPKARWFDGDENSNDKVTRDMTYLEELIKPVNATLIITHHVNKAGKSTLEASSVRGASGFTDATRLFFGMVKKDTEVELKVTKSNYTATWPKPVRLRPSLEFQGVFEEIVEQADEALVGQMVDELAGLLRTHGSQNASHLTQSRKGEGKVYKAMLNKHADWRKLAAQVIALGIDRGVLIETSESTGGRTARRIGAADPESWN